MQQYISIFLVVILSILTIMIVVVGVFVVQVLQRVKNTLDRVNGTIDLAEMKITEVTMPLRSLSGMASSLGTGLKVFESFLGWVNRNKE